jgi:hypothetical protein
MRMGNGRGSHMLDMALAFSRRYRWQSRLVPRAEMPPAFKRTKEDVLTFTIDEELQAYAG